MALDQRTGTLQVILLRPQVSTLQSRHLALADLLYRCILRQPKTSEMKFGVSLHKHAKSIKIWYVSTANSGFCSLDHSQRTNGELDTAVERVIGDCIRLQCEQQHEAIIDWAKYHRGEDLLGK